MQRIHGLEKYQTVFLALYKEIDCCGHYEIFEEATAVNALIVEFFSDPDLVGLPGVFD
jgi:hypothetical protein